MKLTKKILAGFLTILTLFNICSVSVPVLAADYTSIVTDSNVTEEEFSNLDEESPEPEIISEITEKREENIKHFMLSDGSFMVAQYNNPVHYQDDSGLWIDIDNTINKTEATNEQFELFGTEELYSTNKAVDNVIFAEKSNSNTLVYYEAKEYPISLNYHSAKNSAIKIVENNKELTGDDAFLTLPNVTQEVIYENVFSGVDLQYIVSPGELKENIILKNKNAQNSFTVNYNIGELTAEAVDEHTINLMAGNEIVYTISAPYMIDSNSEKSEAVTLDVDKNKNGKLCVNIVADSSWLQAEERAYPVTVDPTISFINDNGIEGAYVSNGTIAEANGSIYVSKGHSTMGDTYALIRLYGLNGFWGIDHVISAKLNLPFVGTAAENLNLFIYEAESVWNDTSYTWNTGHRISSDAVDYFTVTSSSSAALFNITKLYHQWENANCEYDMGAAIKLGSNGLVQLSVQSDEPVLLLEYISTVGIDEEFSYSEFDMGSAGYVYVNNLSGNLVISRDEMDTTGEEYPFDLTGTYNSFSSAAEEDSSWIMSHESGVISGSCYVHTDGSGWYIEGYADKTVGDEIALDPNSHENQYGFDKLKILETSSFQFPIINVTVTYPSLVEMQKNGGEEKYHYRTDGGLVKKLVSNEVVFLRENDPESGYNLIDAGGDRINVVETNASNTYTQQKKIGETTYEDGDVLVYNKDESGNVTSITLNEETQALFTYDEKGRMTSVTNDVGYKLTFGYPEDSDSRKVASIAESKNGTQGQQVSYQRGISTTTARTSGADGVFDNEDDLFTCYKFDKDCKLVSTQSSTVDGEDLGAVTYEHNNDKQNTLYGSISAVSAMGKNIDNLLRNHNIESTDYWTAKAIADNDAVYTASLTNEKYYVGRNSFKVTTTDFTQGGAAGYCQTITPDMGLLQSGETYVASAYINASDFTKDADTLSNTSYGAFVMAEVKTQSGTERYYSNCVTSTGDKWQRSFLTFEVPSDYIEIIIGLIVRNGAGTAYFDAVQLEEGDYPGQYNMLENGSFKFTNSSSFPTDWEKHNLTSSDKVVGGEMKITGATGKNGAVRQDISLSGASQDDTYTFSARAKAASVPAVDDGTPQRHFSVRVKAYYKDAEGEIHDKVVAVSEYNHYDDNWQYTSGSFSLKHEDPTLTPVQIRILLAFYRQCNTAYFDNAVLYRSNDVYDLTEETSDDTAQDEETAGDSYTYDADGRILTYTNEEGVIYTYTYNSYGDVLSVLNSENKGDVFEYEVYDTDKTRVTKETYEDGTVYDYTYHSGDVVATETVTTENDDETTTVEVYNYDAHSNLISYTVDNELKESYTYTVIGGEYLVATETADGYVTAYTYNADGETTSIIKTLNGAEVEKDLYEYHSDDKYLTKHTHTKNGKSLTTHYNSEGAVTAVEHNGFAYKYKYDDFGNTEDVSVGMVDDIECENDISLIKYEYYSDKSKLKKITYGNNDTEEYTYNAFGSIIQKKVDDLGYAYYRYDNMGRLTYEKDYVADRRTYHNYDLEGRLESTQVLDNSKLNSYEAFLFSSANVYDDENRVTRKDMKGKQYALDTYYYYNNDESGLISSVATTVGGSRRLNYTYNDDGQVTSKSMTLTTPYVNTYTYNDDGLIATDTVTAKNGTFAYGYTYDDMANITSITKNGTVQQNYAYDENSQLVREDNRDINKSIVYSYDGYGNILNKKEYAFTTGELGAVTDTITYSYDSVWKDKLTSYDGQSITYDSMGNPLNYRGATLTWNGRRLMSYNKDGTSIAYEYDSNGMRTSKTVNGVRQEYYYDENGQLLYEIKQGVYELYYKYDADGNLFSITRYRYSDGAKHVFYAITNTRGDVIELRENSGAIYATYTYDSWGRCVSVKNSSGAACSVNTVAVQSSIRYRGYVYDYETGLYYLQSRYYDPEVGRFLNADDVNFIGYSGENLSYNAFAYCENNAVNDIDLLGMISYKKVKEFFVELVVCLKDFLIDEIEESFSFKNGILTISTWVVAMAIDGIITLATTAIIYRGAMQVAKYIINKVSDKHINKIVQIYNFIVNRFKDHKVLKNFAKFALKKAAKKTIKKAIKKVKGQESLLKKVASDLFVSMLINESMVLKKLSSLKSAVSSIGGFIAFILDRADGSWDDKIKFDTNKMLRRYV